MYRRPPQATMRGMIKKEGRAMDITWKGTASLVLSGEGQHILFDPFVPLPGSPAPIRLENFDGYNTIFITHGHFDHIYSLPEIVRRNPSVTIYCTATPYAVLQKKGIDPARLVLIRNGQTLEIGNFRVEVFHGKHAVLPKASWHRLRSILTHPARGNLFLLLKENAICKENGETVFYQVTSKGETVSVMGSLNLRGDVDYPQGSDALILPYNGWEDNYPPAVNCIERLMPKRVYLDHYDDTFPPLTGPLDLAPIKAKYPHLVQELTYDRTITVCDKAIP